MDPFVVVKQTRSAVTSVKALRTFVLGGELGKILRSVGDVHYKSAIRALRDAEEADLNKDQDGVVHQLNRAIDGFNYTYQAYMDTIGGPIRRTLGFMRFPNAVAKNFRKACVAAVCMTVCYNLLGKQYMVKKYRQLAMDAFAQYREYKSESDRKATINPSGYSDASILSVINSVLSEEQKEIEDLMAQQESLSRAIGPLTQE